MKTTQQQKCILLKLIHFLFQFTVRFGINEFLKALSYTQPSVSFKERSKYKQM